jgi:hypothetical protein
MSQEHNQEQTEQQSSIADASQENKNSRNWRIEIISAIAVGYLIFSLCSPMFLKQGQQSPRKIETPDLIIVILVLLFNSGLLNRLEDFGISQESGITAKFKQRLSKKLISRNRKLMSFKHNS